MRRLLVSCLLIAGLGFVGLPATADDEPDVIVLQTGERLACRIDARTQAFVTVRIGERSYRIERASLRAVQYAGKPEMAPQTTDLVRMLAKHVTSKDPLRQRAAAAALATFGGVQGRIYLEAAASDPQDAEIAKALRAFIRDTKPDDTAEEPTK